MIWWLLATIWAGGIFFLSHQPELPSPPGIGIDVGAVAGHYIVYFVLCGLLILALRRSGLDPRRAAILAVVISLLYGISDEWHQSFVPNRDASLFDVGVDLFGIVTAGLTPFLARRLRG